MRRLTWDHQRKAATSARRDYLGSNVTPIGDHKNRQIKHLWRFRSTKQRISTREFLGLSQQNAGAEAEHGELDRAATSFDSPVGLAQGRRRSLRLPRDPRPGLATPCGLRRYDPDVGG